MKINKAIQKRRSYYPNSYTGAQVDNHIIEEMLELANWAPTHKYTEPWRFWVFEGNAMHELIDKLCDLYIRATPQEQFSQQRVDKMMARKTQLSHIVVIGMKRHKDRGIPEFEEIAAVSMAVQNMWLYLAQYKDIGAYWSTPKESLSLAFAHHLALAEDERCLGLFYIGTRDSSEGRAVSKRTDWKEKVKWFKN